MEQTKKVAVIGGTGKSGKYLVKQLLDQDFQIKVLVRNPERLLNHNSFVEVIIGDANDYEVIRTLLKGCDAVISALGLGIPPSEPTIFSQATQNIIRAMNEYNVSRYIVLTGLNVDASLDKKGAKTKSATEWMYANYPKSTADRQLEYKILSDSNIDWTLVRLPMIEQTDVSYTTKISLVDCPGDKVSATDLIFFLIDQITDNNYIRKAPFIANV